MPQPEVTALSPADEQRFQAWARTNRVPDVDHPDSHYDYRGWWQQSGGPAVRFGVDHFPDTFKQHGHPTFSVESQYSTGPTDGGTWHGETFMPPPDAAPDDRLLTVPEFVQQIKQQAPDYASWPDDDLAGAMLDKYPELRARVEHGDELAQNYRRANATTVPPDLERRKDSRAIGIDYDWIANQASKLPPPLQRSVAQWAAMLGSVLESVSDPVSLATLGAGRAPSMDVARRSVASPTTLSLPSGKAIVQGAYKAAKFVKSPGKESMKFLADEFIKRMEAASAARAAAPATAPAAIPTAAVPRPPPVAVPAAAVAPPPVAAAPAAVVPPVRTPSAASAALPDQKALNEAALAVRRAAYQARVAAGEAPATPTQVAQAVQTVVKAEKVKLTGVETKAAMDLVKRGLSPDDALAAILKQREFLEKMGGGAVGDAAAKAAIKARGYKS